MEERRVEQPDVPTETAKPATSLVRRILRAFLILAAGVFALLVVAVGLFIFWPVGAPRQPAAPSAAATAAATSSPQAAATASAEPAKKPKLATEADAIFAEMMVGEWKQENKADQSLVIREDGTATMTVKVDSYYTYVFGPQIEADIEWSIDNGKLKFVMTGAKPEGKIDLLMSMVGKERIQKIHEATMDRFVLEKPEGGKLDRPWVRIKGEDDAASTKG